METFNGEGIRGLKKKIPGKCKKKLNTKIVTFI
jgi:hypothetical protein